MIQCHLSLELKSLLVSRDTRGCYDSTMKVRVTSRCNDDGCPEGIYDVTEENIVLFLLGLGSSGVLDF